MTHWRTKKILAIARAAKVAKAQREIMQNGNNIIKRGRGRPPRKVQMNGGGGQVDYNNAARKYVYVRSPTKPDPTVVTRRQIKSEGTDPNDVGHFLSTPTQRGKRLYHFRSTQQIRRKLAKNQNEAEMAQSTSKRQLYKNPHFPSQSTPAVTTRRNRQQQMHQSGNGNIASSSTHLRGKKLRRQKCPPPRFTPTWRAKRGGLRVPRVEVDYAETTGEEEEENNYEEEEEEDPLSEIDLLCRSHSSDSGSSNDSKMSNSNESTGNSTKLTKMDQKMIAKNKFAKQQMEVAIDNGQLDRAVHQILRTRSEEMVPDARPQSSILFQPSPCFALASCLPEFERISAQLGLELREECDSFVFLGLDSPIPALVGSLLCFSESADANSICVDEFRQLQLAGTFEWSKVGKAQFLDAVFGRCVQFFAIPVEKFNTNE